MENKLTGKKLKNQLSLIMILLVVLVVLFIGVTIGLTFVSQTKGQVKELMTTNSNTIILSLNEYIDFLKKDITTIAVGGSITTSKLSHEDKQKNIITIKENRDDISSLYTIDSQYIALNDASSEDVGENYSGEYWAEDAMALAPGSIYFDIPSYDEWTDNITMTIMYRLKSDGFDGLVSMDIHYDVINGIVNQDQFGSDGYSMLLADDGLIITHPDEQLVLDKVNMLDKAKGNPQLEKAIKNALDNEEGLVSDVKYDGKDMMFYYQNIKGTDWTLVTVLDNSHYNSILYTEIIYMGIIGLISIIIAIVFALIFSRRIAGPISQMSVRMQQFAKGDLHTPMPEIKSKNEIGVLNNSLRDSIDFLSLYINDISGSLKSITEGDISFDINMEYIGDFGPIKKSLNGILDSMNNVLGTIKQAAKEVDATSEQMAASAQQLSGNTIEKAGTTDQLDVTFKNIKEGLENTAQNTANALERTSKVQSQIAVSADEMQDMLRSMDEISETSSSISNIIKAIDDIAFQTNILSLNAAVEAARAGNHGKGFGVVADEVRELANRSTESARQSDSLIKNSLDAVEKGGKVAQKSWEKIKDAEVLVKEVADLITEIEEMSARQASSASDIYASISQLNGIIQNDSAMSEENAGQSEELSMMATELQRKLSFFTLRENSKTDTRLIADQVYNVKPEIQNNIPPEPKEPKERDEHDKY